MNPSSVLVIAQQGGTGELISMLVMFGIVALIFWFLVIRPQQKEHERHQELVSGLKAGDQVVTAGGIFGTVKSIDGSVLQLEIGGGTKIKIDREKIQKKQDDFFASEEEDDDGDEDEEKDDD